MTTMIHPAHLVAAPHEVTDAAKVARIAAAMRVHGWQGEPLLAVRYGDGYQAWTGTHRLAAAEQAGVSVPLYVLDLTEEQEAALDGWWYDAPTSRPLDQECMLDALRGVEGIDAEAVRIYEAEVSKHDAE